MNKLIYCIVFKYYQKKKKILEWFIAKYRTAALFLSSLSFLPPEPCTTKKARCNQHMETSTLFHSLATAPSLPQLGQLPAAIGRGTRPCSASRERGSRERAVCDPNQTPPLVSAPIKPQPDPVTAQCSQHRSPGVAPTPGSFSPFLCLGCSQPPSCLADSTWDTQGASLLTAASPLGWKYRHKTGESPQSSLWLCSATCSLELLRAPQLPRSKRQLCLRGNPQAGSL